MLITHLWEKFQQNLWFFQSFSYKKNGLGGILKFSIREEKSELSEYSKEYIILVK